MKFTENKCKLCTFCFNVAVSLKLLLKVAFKKKEKKIYLKFRLLVSKGMQRRTTEDRHLCRKKPGYSKTIKGRGKQIKEGCYAATWSFKAI
jgi:hypothetical protein